jgi:hypothetical protein
MLADRATRNVFGRVAAYASNTATAAPTAMAIVARVLNISLFLLFGAIECEVQKSPQASAVMAVFPQRASRTIPTSWYGVK